MRLDLSKVRESQLAFCKVNTLFTRFLRVSKCHFTFNYTPSPLTLIVLNTDKNVQESENLCFHEAKADSMKLCRNAEYRVKFLPVRSKLLSPKRTPV